MATRSEILAPLCSAGLGVATPDKIGRLAYTGTVDTHTGGNATMPVSA